MRPKRGTDGAVGKGVRDSFPFLKRGRHATPKKLRLRSSNCGYQGTTLILMPLDSLRGVALSNIKNRAIRQPFSHVNLKNYLVARQKLIDGALNRCLPKTNRKPTTLHRAMRYSLFAGGKRLRPILCLAAAEACRGKINDALPLACALECIHTYSLVHDDLPSMDNDDFRRGRPTCHKVFGEGIAVLAGDALLTIAFEIVSTAKPAPRYDISILLREVAVAAGSQRLIAGQVADLEAEGKRVKRDQLRFIHENKTAAMLKSSVRLGAMSANADARKLSAITRFGPRLGLAVQIIDDILEVTQTSEILGKSPGKDVPPKKPPYPPVMRLYEP